MFPFRKIHVQHTQNFIPRSWYLFYFFLFYSVWLADIPFLYFPFYYFYSVKIYEFCFTRFSRNCLNLSVLYIYIYRGPTQPLLHWIYCLRVYRKWKANSHYIVVYYMLYKEMKYFVFKEKGEKKIMKLKFFSVLSGL